LMEGEQSWRDFACGGPGTKRVTAQLITRPWQVMSP